MGTLTRVVKKRMEHTSDQKLAEEFQEGWLCFEYCSVNERKREDYKGEKG